MDVLALFFTALGLASWLGSAIFMNFIVGPVVNRRLAPSQAAELMEQVAPRQHWVGWFGAGLMAVGGAGALLYHPWRVPTITFLVLTSIALALSLYAALVVLPRTISLRKRLQSSAGSELGFQVRERYDQATRMATYLNILTLLVLLGATAALAAILSRQPPPAGG